MEMIPWNRASLWRPIFLGKNISHIFQSHLEELYRQWIRVGFRVITWMVGWTESVSFYHRYNFIWRWAGKGSGNDLKRNSLLESHCLLNCDREQNVFTMQCLHPTHFFWVRWIIQPVAGSNPVSPIDTGNWIHGNKMSKNYPSSPDTRQNLQVDVYDRE